MGEVVQFDPVNYKNGPKNNWRRTMWNAVRRRTTDPRDALVLYLPGEQNLDAPVAMRHGFKCANLIAVERDPSVARKIRAKGHSAIEAELAVLMMRWPDSPRVSVVIADLVTGMDRMAALVLYVWLTSPAFAGGTLVMNVMRGRENDELYRFLRERPLCGQLLPPKHRGQQMLWHLACATEENMYRTDPDGTRRPNVNWQALPSYRSPAGMWFDSMIFRDIALPRHDGYRIQSARGLLRTITATMAVRTMRLRGDFQ